MTLTEIRRYFPFGPRALSLLLLATVSLCATPSGAQALKCPVTATNPNGVCGPNNSLLWTVPVTNTDGTALTDFARFKVKTGLSTGVGVLPTPVTVTVTDVGPVGIPPTPILNTDASIKLSVLPIKSAPLIFACIVATDIVSNDSPCSVEANFPFKGASPSAPTNVRVGP